MVLGLTLPLAGMIYFYFNIEYLHACCALRAHARASAIHGMQEGAAQRLVKARPGQDIYRSINCLVHYFATPHYHFRVPRTVFYPRPHVDAAMTTFALKPASDRLLDARLESGFVKFVEKAFLAKRKRLRNTLGPQYSSSQVEAALQAVGLKQDTRAVELSASSYALLYAELGSSLKH